MFQWMHRSIAMKRVIRTRLTAFSQVWHSHDCGFNSALSDRSAGSRILENSVVVVYGGRGLARGLGPHRTIYPPTPSRTAGCVSLFLPFGSRGSGGTAKKTELGAG